VLRVEVSPSGTFDGSDTTYLPADISDVSCGAGLNVSSGDSFFEIISATSRRVVQPLAVVCCGAVSQGNSEPARPKRFSDICCGVKDAKFLSVNKGHRQRPNPFPDVRFPNFSNQDSPLAIAQGWSHALRSTRQCSQFLPTDPLPTTLQKLQCAQGTIRLMWM